MTPPSGTQVRLTDGSQTVTVASVGASLREYRVDGIDVVLPYPAGSIAPAFSGKLLAPWPNRLADGRYRFAGVDHQVALTEPDRRTALHGLAGFADFAPTRTDTTSATLTHTLVPTPGYPWAVRLEVTFALGDDGLTVTTTADQDGPGDAPFGFGAHPWLHPGPGPLDGCTLRLEAARHVRLDDRLLPVGTEPSDPRLGAGLPLAGVALDDAWQGVAHGADDRTWVWLTRSDGRRTGIWGDATTKAWQVCTGDEVPAVRRAGIAVEPMTCVADAFRTGDDLVVLRPGEPFTTRWGLRLA